LGNDISLSSAEFVLNMTQHTVLIKHDGAAYPQVKL